MDLTEYYDYKKRYDKYMLGYLKGEQAEKKITQALHAHAQEQVAEERERVRKLIAGQKTEFLWDDDKHKHASNIRLENTLNDILQALTPTKET